MIFFSLLFPGKHLDMYIDEFMDTNQTVSLEFVKYFSNNPRQAGRFLELCKKVVFYKSFSLLSNFLCLFIFYLKIKVISLNYKFFQAKFSKILNFLSLKKIAIKNFQRLAAKSLNKIKYCRCEPK